MLSNYFRLAFRNLLKYKAFSAINLFGLTIGLACCLLIGIYIANELSFDRYHSKADRIWRVSREFNNPDGTMQLHLGHLAPPFGPLLKEEFSGVEEVARLLQSNATLRQGDQLFREDQFFVAEPAMFRIFDIPLVQGSAATLEEPNTVMLNESSAQRIFGKQDPVNQILRFNDLANLKVTGVFKDFPYNAHFHPDFLASFSTLRDTLIYGQRALETNWGNNSFSTFVRLQKGYRAQELEAQFPAFLDKVMAKAMANPTQRSSEGTKLHLMPLADIHLRSHLDSELEENGDIQRVWIFAAIALFVLLIACVNYMNLNTARASTRAREIGIRKVAGAHRREIVGQFLGEALLLSLLAMVLATALTLVALPLVNQILREELSISTSQMGGFVLAAVGLTLLTGLLAGLYPAFYLSNLIPLKTLKGDTSEDARGGAVGLRKVLVVSQFAISLVLMIATLVVFRQLTFMQQKSLGMNKDQVVTLNFYDPLATKYEGFYHEMMSSPAIKTMTCSSRLPSGRLLDSFGSARLQMSADTLEPTQVDLKSVTIDHRFFPLYDIGIAAGRNYQSDQGADRFASFILTAFGFLSLKIDGARTTEALAHIRSVWQKFLPEFPYDYHFLDEQYGQLYAAEQRQGRVFVAFAGIAIAVACLGLFGLASFTVERRRKEIGIRKVLGASVTSVTAHLSKDFLKLVLVAILVASPLAWWSMNKWLQDFAYRIDIQWWMFAAAGLGAVAIAFLTVGFQSMRAALANPVKSLRSE